MTLLASLDRESLKRKYRDIENLYLLACENAAYIRIPRRSPAPKAGPEADPDARADRTPTNPPLRLRPIPGRLQRKNKP